MTLYHIVCWGCGFAVRRGVMEERVAEIMAARIQELRGSGNDASSEEQKEEPLA